MQNDISSVTLTDLVRIFSRNGSIVGEDCLVEGTVITATEPLSVTLKTSQKTQQSMIGKAVHAVQHYPIQIETKLSSISLELT